MAKQLDLRVGLTRVQKAMWLSEPDFVSQMNAVMKLVQTDLEYILNEFEDVTPDITVEALKPTFEKSKVYCPKDTRELVESAYLEVVQRKRGGPIVEMGYGKGGKPRYAPYVHEMTTNKHEAPTRSKFLEAAINEDMFDLIDRVAAGYAQFARM